MTDTKNKTTDYPVIEIYLGRALRVEPNKHGQHRTFVLYVNGVVQACHPTMRDCINHGRAIVDQEIREALEA